MISALVTMAYLSAGAIALFLVVIAAAWAITRPKGYWF